jgi:hypothetical protein
MIVHEDDLGAVALEFRVEKLDQLRGEIHAITFADSAVNAA